MTAVEWLFDELIKHNGIISPDIIEKAITMEKEQIAEAYRTGVEEDVYNTPLRTGKMYYNETYGE